MHFYDIVGVDNPVSTGAMYLDVLNPGGDTIRFTKESIVSHGGKDFLGNEVFHVIYFWGKPKIKRKNGKKWRVLHERS